MNNNREITPQEVKQLLNKFFFMGLFYGCLLTLLAIVIMTALSVLLFLIL